MKPYAELLSISQPNPVRAPGYTRIRDTFPALLHLRQHAYADFVNVDEPTVPTTFYDPERTLKSLS
jgi:hypothetical protein